MPEKNVVFILWVFKVQRFTCIYKASLVCVHPDSWDVVGQKVNVKKDPTGSDQHGDGAACREQDLIQSRNSTGFLLQLFNCLKNSVNIPQLFLRWQLRRCCSEPVLNLQASEGLKTKQINQPWNFVSFIFQRTESYSPLCPKQMLFCRLGLLYVRWDSSGFCPRVTFI